MDKANKRAELLKVTAKLDKIIDMQTKRLLYNK